MTDRECYIPTPPQTPEARERNAAIWRETLERLSRGVIVDESEDIDTRPPGCVCNTVAVRSYSERRWTLLRGALSPRCVVHGVTAGEQGFR